MPFDRKRWQQKMALLVKNQNADNRLKYFNDLVTADDPIETWQDFQRWIKPLEKRSFFRGLSNHSYNLETTIERAALFEWTSKDGNSSGYDRENEFWYECEVLKRFQAGAHHYLPSPPDDDEIIDWLAIMQHHGAPTRMMDWTRSAYIALAFAMEKEPTIDSAIWAIDQSWLEHSATSMLRREYDAPYDQQDELRKYFNKNLLTKWKQRPTIIEAKSRRINQRMMAQQGVHLCRIGQQVQTSVTLMSMLLYPKPWSKPVLRKIRITTANRPQFLENLQRMNITAATLFPGLDGFARSLGFDIDIWKGDAAINAEKEHQKWLKRIRRYHSTEDNDQPA